MAPQYMSLRFKNLFADKIVLASFIGVIVTLILYGIFLLFTYQKLPPLIPLFNQVPWGEGRFATKIQLFIPFGIASIIVICNTSLLLFFSLDIPLVTRLVCLTNFLVSLFALLLIIRSVLIII